MRVLWARDSALGDRCHGGAHPVGSDVWRQRTAVTSMFCASLVRAQPLRLHATSRLASSLPQAWPEAARRAPPEAPRIAACRRGALLIGLFSLISRPAVCG